MGRHMRGAITTIGLTSLLLFGFQNCGEQPTSDDFVVNEDGTVQIVDQWGPENVSFFEKSVEVDAAEKDVDILGYCHRNRQGESLKWVVVEEQNGLEVLVEGSAFCERAGFNMKISAVDRLDCRSSYEVYIESDDGSEDMMRLHRRCD
ncbi:MAG: hypothetical protein R2827_04855 [Bdellovibrionales bacterium]